MSKKKSKQTDEFRPMQALPGHDDFQVKDDFDTLMRAEEIKGDGERMGKVHKHAKKKKKHMSSIADLKGEYNRVAKEEDSE